MKSQTYSENSGSEYYLESVDEVDDAEENFQDVGLMMWDDDEVFIPQVNDDNGSPRVQELGQRNSLVFSTEDVKEQYHMLLRVSKERGTVKRLLVTSGQNLPKLKKVVS